MDNRPVGIFDSGHGGLTALRAFRALMPDENIIYFADSGRAPYGDRSLDELRLIARQDLDFIRGRGVKAVLIACGTISSVAPEALESCEVPTIGVLKSTVDAVARLDADKIGILATPASIRIGAFEKAIKKACPGRLVMTAGCQSFAPLIEQGHLAENDALIAKSVAEYLAPMKAENVDALVLGCTHYGIIADAILDYMGSGIKLVEASRCAAEAMRDKLSELGITGSGAAAEYYTSGDPAEFERLSSVFLGGRTVCGARHVPPMRV